MQKKNTRYYWFAATPASALLCGIARVCVFVRKQKTRTHRAIYKGKAILNVLVRQIRCVKWFCVQQTVQRVAFIANHFIQVDILGFDMILLLPLHIAICSVPAINVMSHLQVRIFFT